jgi:hypothetical protein
VSGHGAHLALGLAPIAGIAAVTTAVDIRNRLGKPVRRPSTPVAAAAGLSLVAASVHGVVCPEHFREATLYGLFFAAAALAQLGWAAAVLVRPTRRVVVLGLAGNVAVLALWLLTRTVGIPLGPEAGTVEAVGGLDLLASAAELGVVLLLTQVVSASTASERFSH